MKIQSKQKPKKWKDPSQNQKVKRMKTSINRRNPHHQTIPFSNSKKKLKHTVNQLISKKLWTTPLLYKQQIKNNRKKIIKWKQFGKLNIKTYPHPTLNFLKGVIKSPDLASGSLEEIRLYLKTQGVTDVRRISIHKETIIDTNTCILTFNKPTIPTCIRIGSMNSKIETYIPIPLRCQKCPKYGHPKDKCTRPSIRAKCGNSNHTELECKNPFNCINCTREHPV